MNYGRYFRLNQALSKVVSGVAIYDYIDLPAYFGPSEDNPMSPKYPISVTITSDTVCFRLHYSAFKLEKSGDSKFPQYAYDRDDIDRKALDSKKVNVGMAHMEEVILELPLADISSIRLSDTIKNIYNSTFPQVIDENTSMGGRYLEQLIKKRFPVKKDYTSEKGGVEETLYRNLRKVSDETVSYSTLWLMDLVREDRIYLYSKQKVKGEDTKKEKEIDIVTGFLRKLLLDFMFDLKHSDVFQNSADYQKMYSGLMSDFYFSALMHKCEYYYYRKLTSKAIGDVEDSYKTKKKIIKSENQTEAERKEKSLFIEKEKEDRIKAIAVLYANELVKAEDLWVKDIMNPQAEKDFEHKYPGKHNILREIFEYYSFKQWPSWFAEPEEEMRRVCFTMKDETGERHICNADTLTKYLGFSRDNDDNTISKILDIRDDDRKQISRWFLKQYAFSDVLHLHLFKHANLFFIFFFALPILFSWFSREKLLQIYTPMVYGGIMMLIAFLLFAWLYKYNVCKSCGCQTKCKLYKICFYRTISSSGIVKARTDIIHGKIKKVCIFILFITLFSCLGLLPGLNKFINEHNLGSTIAIFVFLTLVIAVFAILYKYPIVISRLHLTLPRLVASITLAWITLSMGFDLYVSYFDSIPSIPYIAVICVVVFLFVVYSINLVIPHSSPLRKLLRSLELMIISYFISLSVGFLIINFLGPKYLERGGFINDYYTQYVENDSCWGVHYYRDNNAVRNNGEAIVKDSNFRSQVDSLESVYLTLKDSNSADNVKKIHQVADITYFWGMDIFVLRDFLLMFAFIAMFTGIFIQLIIFGDNKQMTEL